jgi:sugar/nucleoside kinase (ribokinase family)
MKMVLGIGNALVDILIGLEDDAFLAEVGLEKGSMTLVDRETMNAVLDKAAALKLNMRKSSGGSAANAIHGMAQLGTPAGYIGKIGDDDYGSFFRSYMEQNNICATLFKGEADTGKSIVMVSKDSERTFATYLGAAVELAASDLSGAPFNGYDYFLLEGYLVQDYSLVEKAVELAKKANCEIAVDLASFNIVKENLDFLHSLVENHVDIVFANEEEAKSFTGKENPEEALNDISGKCGIAVVKTGKEGSLIKAGAHQYRVPPIAASCIDTTGAGDLYASGFFYGLTSGHSLDICGKIGSITAGKIIGVVGAKMDADKWDEARGLISELTNDE